MKNALKICVLFFLVVQLSPLAGILSTQENISPRLLNLITQKGENHRFTAWVFFSDKGTDLAQQIETAYLSLNPRTMQRRLRHRGNTSLADAYDVPVKEEYVDLVGKLVSRIRHRSRWLNAVSVEASGQILIKVSELDFVKRIEKVASYRFRKPHVTSTIRPEKSIPVLKKYTLDYGPSYSQVTQLNVPVLHDMGYSGNGVLICMLDTGFNNLNHQALDHLHIISTWDFVNGDPNVFDEPGQMGVGEHGTETLGTIAGYHPGRLIGPAYGASFILGKTENTTWERHIEEDHWVAGAEWADALGADIISSSLGYRDEFTHGETDYSWEDMDGQTTIVTKGANIAAGKGILIVNSAGNEGTSIPPENSLLGPADSPYVLAAGAVNSTGQKTDFSSTGPTSDGRIKPDVMAQGLDVFSAGIHHEDEYVYLDGTSFSCPLLAGVAALVLEINPTWSNQDIMAALKITPSNADAPDNLMGWGIANAFDAAFYALKSIYPPNFFSLERKKNNYGFFVQYVDSFSWQHNPRNIPPVANYRIYAQPLNGSNQSYSLIAELEGGVLSYERRGLLADETFLYKITSVNAAGEESDPDYVRN